jgi:hypothetical protein
MPFFIKKILFPILIFLSILLLVFKIDSHDNTTTPATDISYTLKSYKNTIALYCGDEIVEIYDNIVLNTLPPEDVKNFNSGIPVSTPAQAELYLEDFD